MSGPAPSQITPHQRIFGIVMSYGQCRALDIAFELKLAELLAEGPLHVDVLAEKTGSDASSLFRLMRALASLEIFVQVSPRVFANTPASECLRPEVPGTMWPGLRLRSLFFADAWAELGYSVRTGRPSVEKIQQRNIWDFLRQNPEAGAVFDKMMQSITGPATAAVTAAYDWGRFRVIADIGGGIGTQLVSILEAHADCRGVLLDQPQVLKGAIAHDRVERREGDLFQGPLPKDADAYILRFILHDWSDSDALRILSNVRQAMKADARLMIAEMIVPDIAGQNLAVWADLGMLISTGGRERTAEEFRELLRKAEFNFEQIVPTASPFSIVVAQRG